MRARRRGCSRLSEGRHSGGWGGVEWSEAGGVKWGGVGWSGVEWSRVGRAEVERTDTSTWVGLGRVSERVERIKSAPARDPCVRNRNG